MIAPSKALHSTSATEKVEAEDEVPVSPSLARITTSSHAVGNNRASAPTNVLDSPHNLSIRVLAYTFHSLSTAFSIGLKRRCYNGLGRQLAQNSTQHRLQCTHCQPRRACGHGRVRTILELQEVDARPRYRLWRLSQ